MQNGKSIPKSPLKFFLLVYAMSIPVWIIGTFFKIKGLPLDIPVTDIVAAFTPLIAACILVNEEEGYVGIKKLLRRVFDFSRIKQKIWYVPIILLMPFVYLVIYEVMNLIKLPLAIEPQIHYSTIPILFIFFFFGAIAEEVGYMGYAIDSMQASFGALSASILIGIPWAVWHYPSIIQQGHNLNWIVWGTLGTVAVRVLIVWIYNNTGKSLFACILFHTMTNLGRTSFPRDEIHNPLVDYPDVHYSIIAITAGVVVFFWGTKTLARFKYFI